MMKRRIRLVALAASLAGAVVAGQPATAHGALAIDSNHGSRWGTSWEQLDEEAAIRRALSECGGGCHVVVVFHNICAAYAADQRNGSSRSGWSSGTSRTAAEQSALADCRKNGGRSCAIRVWGCEKGEPPAPWAYRK